MKKGPKKLRFIGTGSFKGERHMKTDRKWWEDVRFRTMHRIRTSSSWSKLGRIGKVPYPGGIPSNDFDYLILIMK